jgi:hypothetical protein
MPLSCSVLAARRGIWGDCIAAWTARTCRQFRATQNAARSFFRSRPSSDRSQKAMRHYPLVQVPKCPEGPVRCGCSAWEEKPVGQFQLSKTRRSWIPARSASCRSTASVPVLPGRLATDADLTEPRPVAPKVRLNRAQKEFRGKARCTSQWHAAQSVIRFRSESALIGCAIKIGGRAAGLAPPAILA